MSDTDAPRSRGFRVMTAIGRLVLVTVGRRTQTVGICTPTNQPGEYEIRYRLDSDRPLDPEDLARHSTLSELQAWLTDLGAVDAGSAVRRPLPELIPAALADPEWLHEALGVVESEIDALLKGFMAEPYLHRREQGLHAELFYRLKHHDILRATAPIGTTGQVTQLVHREWPETHPQNADRRGSYDLAIIAPHQLVSSTSNPVTLEHFALGYVEAPIVIEMGLNYRDDHLIDQDHKKLRENHVRYGYLIHLERDVTPNERILQFLRSPERQSDLQSDGYGRHTKIAYGHWTRSDKPVVKFLDEAVLPSS